LKYHRALGAADLCRPIELSPNLGDGAKNENPAQRVIGRGLGARKARIATATPMASRHYVMGLAHLCSASNQLKL
jgi:hypothetical protein